MPVPGSARVGTPATTAADVDRQRQLAAVVQSAEMVGAAQVVFDLTLAWVFDRYTFGRPLASYQVIKHRFADMKLWLEAGHAIAAAAATELDEEVPSAPETASVAKAYVGDHLTDLVQECVQLHGGIGLTYEHDLHLFLRRVVADRQTHGTPAEHRMRVADVRLDVGASMLGASMSGASVSGGGRGVTEPVETVEDFRARARAWIADHLPRADPGRRPTSPTGSREATSGRSSRRSTATGACSASSGTAGSRGSASPASTAGSVSLPSTSGRSTPRRSATRPRG